MARVDAFERVHVEVLRRSGLEDHELLAVAAVLEELWQGFDIVTTQKLGRIVPNDLDRAAQPLEPSGLVGPDERLQ